MQNHHSTVSVEVKKSNSKNKIQLQEIKNICLKQNSVDNTDFIPLRECASI